MALVSVRVHGFVGAALLALAAPLALLAALRFGPFDADLHLLAALGGMTLLLEAVAFWYLPSFAKREIVLDGMASYSGVILFPAALVGAVFDIGGMRVVGPPLALGIFGIILLASPLVGKRWRGDTVTAGGGEALVDRDPPRVPFWRTEGPFRVGDFASMLTLASAAIWFVATGILGLLRPTLVAVLWPVGLCLITLGALAHYVPRNRGRAMSVFPFLAGVAAFEVGAVMHGLARLGFAVPLDIASGLLVGLPLAGLALAPPVATKKAGARMREAAPFLAASVPLAGLAVGLGLAGRSASFVFASYYALLCALAFALAGLVLLTLPVVFNRPPARIWLWPTFLSGLLGAGLLVAGFLTWLPRWPGAAVLAVALAMWLLVLAPLRTPRRICPVVP
jgi:hypothetical protein